MNHVKASWMGLSAQPVSLRIGSTNSVQAYWRLAIMIIATRDAHNWNQRLLVMLAAGVTTGSRRCFSFSQQLDARVRRPRGGHRHAEAFSELHHGAHDGFYFHRTPGLE